MRRWFGLGLVAIAVLATANAAYALRAIGSSAVDLSGMHLRRKVCDIVVAALCAGEWRS